MIVGCGDIGVRVARRLASTLQVIALTSSPARVPALRAERAMPIRGNLDTPRTLRRLRGLATRVLHLAPPAANLPGDARTRSLLQALSRAAGSQPRSFVYGSTSGVYGDCGGAWVAETRTAQPATARAWRRLDAERTVRGFGRASGVRSTILRIPGIYAPDRERGTPRERLLERTPTLVDAEDVHTNHIHAEDLARACIVALWRGRPQRVANVCDDSDLKLGEWLDLAADLYGLPRAPRITRAEAAEQLSPMRLSFLGESRRLSNERMKRELRLALRYPTVRQGLRSG